MPPSWTFTSPLRSTNGPWSLFFILGKTSDHFGWVKIYILGWQPSPLWCCGLEEQHSSPSFTYRVFLNLSSVQTACVTVWPFLGSPPATLLLLGKLRPVLAFIIGLWLEAWTQVLVMYPWLKHGSGSLWTCFVLSDKGVSDPQSWVIWTWSWITVWTYSWEIPSSVARCLTSPLTCFLFCRKLKSETPKTPTTPTSPMSPSFSSAGGPLSPHLSTGDSVRDKCIEMLSAALRTDSEALLLINVFIRVASVWHAYYYNSQFLHRWLQRFWSQLWRHGSRDWRSYPLVYLLSGLK